MICNWASNFASVSANYSQMQTQSYSLNVNRPLQDRLINISKYRYYTPFFGASKMYAMTLCSLVSVGTYVIYRHVFRNPTFAQTESQWIAIIMSSRCNVVYMETDVYRNKYSIFFRNEFAKLGKFAKFC